jgi:hypothetical protein
LRAQAKHQTPQPTKQADILADVQPEIDATLQANEAQHGAYPDAQALDDNHCSLCGGEVNNEIDFCCPHCHDGVPIQHDYGGMEAATA